MLGVNLDDLGDHRPGQRAAAERGRRVPAGRRPGSPRTTCGPWSRRLGLRTWDKPAAACLASRVPYGTPVTLGPLATVAAAESALRALGFGQLRVRHYGDLARIELHGDDLRRRAWPGATRWSPPCARAGYRYVTLDLEGFRSGNLNRALIERRPVTGVARPTRRSAMIEVRVKLTFPEDLVRGPFIAHAGRRARRRAQHPPGQRRRARGLDRVRARGCAAQVEAALAWLRGEGVTVDLLGDVVES